MYVPVRAISCACTYKLSSLGVGFQDYIDVQAGGLAIFCAQVLGISLKIPVLMGCH